MKDQETDKWVGQMYTANTLRCEVVVWVSESSYCLMRVCHAYFLEAGLPDSNILAFLL